MPHRLEPQRLASGEQLDDRGPSLELLYRSHSAWLLRVVRKRFGADQAEDLVQEVYVKAAAYTGGEVRNPRALLMRIAMRAAIDRARRAQVRVPAEQCAGSDLVTAPQQAEALALKQVVLALPEKFRKVFVLSRFGGLSNEEIAEHYGISLKTVEWRMTKALKLCAKALRT